MKPTRIPGKGVVAALAAVVGITAAASPAAGRRLTVQDGLHPIGPPLTALQTKVTGADWITAWLLKPDRLRLNQHMSKLRITPEEARAVGAYLFGGPAPTGPAVAWHGGSAAAGERLFVARGCRGCHTIGATEPAAWSRAPDLAGIGIKVRGDWLFNWLKSPRTYSPATPMPQLTLTDDEIRDLVAFLLSHREGADVVAAVAARKTGTATEPVSDIIRRFDCPKCHVMRDARAFADPLPWTAPPRACAACHEPQLVTHAASIAAPTVEPADSLVEGRRLVAYYSCRGCHRIDGAGGTIADHLERKTLAPPTLEGEGARVQPSWLVEFLQRPKTLRPWLEIRMPDFGLSAGEARVLSEYVAALAHVPATDEPYPPAPVDEVALGRRRLLHYKCLQCHPAVFDNTLPEGVELEDLSINLTLARTRLRPAWIRDFLARPKAVVGTATRMPAAFYTPDGEPKVEHPVIDIDAITAYLGQMDALSVAAERTPTAAPTPIDWSTHPY